MSNRSKQSSKMPILAAIFLVCFVTYNVVLFVVSGFEFHTGTFWTSYAFTLIAFGAVAASGYMARSQDIKLRDWIFGYPVLWHCAVFMAAQLVLSIVFMAFEDGIAWGVAFAVQLVLLAVYAVMVLSCFMSKRTIEEVDTKARVSTTYMKLLQADAEMAAEQSADPAVRSAFLELAEQARYSDPVSNPLLADLEQAITVQLAEAKNYLTNGDEGSARECCKQASMLLLERNKKCKALK